MDGTWSSNNTFHNKIDWGYLPLGAFDQKHDRLDLARTDVKVRYDIHPDNHGVYSKDQMMRIARSINTSCNLAALENQDMIRGIRVCGARNSKAEVTVTVEHDMIVFSILALSKVKNLDYSVYPDGRPEPNMELVGFKKKAITTKIQYTKTSSGIGKVTDYGFTIL